MTTRNEKILLGCISLGQYKLKVGKTTKNIIIMGERHWRDVCGSEGPYLSIMDFLEKYHNKIGNKKILDVFCETEYVHVKKLNWWQSWIKDWKRKSIYNKYAPGLMMLRRDLEFCAPKYTHLQSWTCPDHIRIHLCDVRFSTDKSDNVLCTFHQNVTNILDSDGSISCSLKKIYDFCDHLVNDKSSRSEEYLYSFEYLFFCSLEMESSA